MLVLPADELSESEVCKLLKVFGKTGYPARIIQENAAARMFFNKSTSSCSSIIRGYAVARGRSLFAGKRFWMFLSN